ncbi:MAG: DUF4405 domain-containing protein [Candidatus Aminicenantaceae bacterium]
MKYQSKINFVIDALMFIVMMAIGGIGFLMKFILVPGSERWEIYGSNVDLFFWGMDRHQWGAIHLTLAYVLLGLLSLHIIFHWNQIKSMFCNLIHKKSSRVILTFIFVPLSIVLLLFAFFVNFDVVEPKRGEGGHSVELSRPRNNKSSIQYKEEDGSISSSGDTGQKKEKSRQESGLQVDGSITLNQIENTYNIPAESIKEFLGIPSNTSDYENLGNLKKIYDFHMSDVERFIAKYEKENKISEISEKDSHDNQAVESHEHHYDSTIEVFGSMTLKEVENRYNVPTESIKKFLSIPLSISDYENLGRLRRRYGFRMSDVERFIAEYHKKHI